MPKTTIQLVNKELVIAKGPMLNKGSAAIDMCKAEDILLKRNFFKLMLTVN